MPKVVILIPSRYSASRLPGKPLLKAKGIPLIAHVYKKAKETNIEKMHKDVAWIWYYANKKERDIILENIFSKMCN